MDELTRINQLDNELRDNKFKKLQVEEQIKELEKQREDLDNEYERKKKSKIELEKDRYKSKKLRRKIVEYGKKSSLPEVALKLQPYVNTLDWSKDEIPEEILDGFVSLDNEKKNNPALLDRVDVWLQEFFQKPADGSMDNDN